MRVIQALHWLLDILGREGEADDVRKRLRRLLADPVYGDALRTDLIAGMHTLPAWLQVLLKSVTDEKSRGADDENRPRR